MIKTKKNVTFILSKNNNKGTSKMFKKFPINNNTLKQDFSHKQTLDHK